MHGRGQMYEGGEGGQSYEGEWVRGCDQGDLLEKWVRGEKFDGPGRSLSFCLRY